MWQKIEELMKAVNCAKWPQRWSEIYEEAMEEFRIKGCSLTDPAYYDRLKARYGMLEEHIEIYKSAAAEIGKNPALSAFLTLLCRALKDREHIFNDLREFSQPVSPDGEHDIAYDMLTGLAICSQADYCYQKLTGINLPEDLVLEIMKKPEKGIEHYRIRNNGAYGYSLLGWNQRNIEGYLHNIGRLEFEIFRKLDACVCVFENISGERIALAEDIKLHKSGVALGSFGYEDEEGSFEAHVTETEEYWCGYPYDEKGQAASVPVKLEKSQWRKILAKGDDVIGIHIPAGERLDPEAVSHAIQEAREFFGTYFPDYQYKGFSCVSWLLDPQLETLLGQESNIVKFGKRFTPVTHPSLGQGVFNFVFHKPDMNFEMTELSENTRLERALKNHYLGGKAIFETFGYFF